MEAPRPPALDLGFLPSRIGGFSTIGMFLIDPVALQLLQQPLQGGIHVSIAKYDSLLSPGLKLTEEQYETDRNLVAMEQHITATLSRRGFLGTLMAASAAVAAGTLGTRSASAQTAAPTVVDVLNFALNLEYLEANFYLSVSGGTLPTADAGPTPGAITGAPGKLSLDAVTLALAQALAADEVHHIETIRSTITSLGGTPISQPALNYAFMPVTTQAQFLAAARQFTAVGGSAYAGSAQLLVSNPTVLTAAAQILGAEGQHDGAVNYQIILQSITSPAVDALDVVPTSTEYFTLYSPTSTAAGMPMALAPQRTPQQVLGIVYGVSQIGTTTPAAGVTSGGFFPNGFNGNVKST